EGLGEEGLMGDMANDQRSPFHRPIVAGAQIVEHTRFVAGRRKSLTGVAPNVTGSAGDEDFQAHKTTAPAPEARSRRSTPPPWARATAAYSFDLRNMRRIPVPL